jgi:predicted DNA-binding transcriptional regulator AlpA
MTGADSQGGHSLRQVARSDDGAAAQPASRSASLPPVLLTEDEAATVLGVSKRTFLNLREQPWMPRAIVLGPRMHRYSLDELRAAVANMPRQSERVQPESLLRSQIERMKATGAAA